MFFTRASNSLWCEMASEQRNLSAVSKLNGNQMICTGSCLVFLAGGVLTLGHVLGNEDHQYLLSFLKLGIVYWTSCTTFLNGIVAIVGGFKKTTTAVVLFVAFCIFSCGAQICLVVVTTKLLRKWRKDMDCPPATCPYDEVSILILALICVAALSALMSLAGVLEVTYAIFLEDSRLEGQDKPSFYSTPLQTQNRSSFAMSTFSHTSRQADFDRSFGIETQTDGKAFDQRKQRYAEVTV